MKRIVATYRYEYEMEDDEDFEDAMDNVEMSLSENGYNVSDFKFEVVE